MLGLSSFLTASTAVQSAIGRLMGALGGRSTYTENQSASKATIRDLSKGGILDKASILLTPTSYSDGKMSSVKGSPNVELVSNGNFSALGPELESLPSTSTSPVVVGNHYMFVKYGNNIIGYDGSGVTTVTYFDDVGGAHHYFTSGYNLNGGGSAQALYAGKSYRIQISAKTNFGDYNINTGSTLSGTASNANGLTNTDYVTTTLYVLCTDSAPVHHWLSVKDMAPGQVISINNVSIQELGADWTEEGSDPNSVSFGENGLTIVQSTDLGTDNRAYQLNVTSADKLYKVTYTIHSAQYTASNRLRYYDGNSYVNLPEQGVGTHTFYYTREGANDIWIFNLTTSTNSATDYVTISSLSVRDVSADFTFTRNSSATRVGPDGLIQDMQDVVGESELITNGSFRQVGTEEVTYPNFTNSDLSQWSIAADGVTPRATMTWDAAEFLHLEYDTAIGAALNSGSFGQALNTSYKVTMSVRGTKADGVTAQGSAFGSIGENGELGQVVSNPTLTSAWQDYEFYIVSLAATFRFYLASAEVGDLVDFDSISVLPLGQDWTLGTGWSIGDSVLKSSASVDGTNKTFADQEDVLIGADTDTFKTTFEVRCTSGSSKRLDVYVGVNNINQITVAGSSWQSVTFYDTKVPSTGNSSPQFYFYNQSGEIFEIKNVSVKNITLADDLDIPRISYDKDGLNGHILLEPVRTNQIRYSQNFVTNWGEQGHDAGIDLVTNNIAPDGTSSAYSWKRGSGDTGYYVSPVSCTDENVSYTFSVFVKAKTGSPVVSFGSASLRFDTDDSGGGANTAAKVSFNLADQTFFSGASGMRDTNTVEDFGNGWYRVSGTTFPKTDNSSTFSMRIFKTDSSDTTEIIVWGAQVEKAAEYATSYIPTHTGTAVTRAVETMFSSGNTSLIDSTKGTLYFEAANIGNPDGLSKYTMGISDGTNSNRIYLGYAYSNKINFDNKNAAGANISAISTSSLSEADQKLFNKAAGRYASDNYKLYVNGESQGSDTDAIVYSADSINQLNVASGFQSNLFYGKIKCLAYFNDALTDDEMEVLTGDSYNSFSELAAANGYTIQ